MNQQDRSAFRDVLSKLALNYRREISTDEADLFWTLLEPYSIEDIRLAAVTFMRSKSAFMPNAGDLIAFMPQSESNPPAPEAAWDKALSLMLWDESLTVVADQAIVESWPSHVWPDKIAARLAFLANYPANVVKYGKKQIISLGHNVEGRQPVIDEAIRDGRITAQQAQERLGGRRDTPDVKRLPADGGPDKARTTHTDPDTAHKRLAAMMAELRGTDAGIEKSAERG